MPQHETIDPRILGQRIAEARKARGKTQEEVADYLECSRPTYIAIEKGDRAAKSDEIIKLASFLGRKVYERRPEHARTRGKRTVAAQCPVAAGDRDRVPIISWFSVRMPTPPSVETPLSRTRRRAARPARS